MKMHFRIFPSLLLMLLSALFLNACRDTASIGRTETSTLADCKSVPSRRADFVSAIKSVSLAQVDIAATSVAVRIASATFRPVEPGLRRATAEVVLRNGGPTPVTVTNVWLGGVALGTSPRVSASRLASAFTFDVGGASVAPKAAGAPPEPPWWGFTPSRTVPPGGYAAFRLSLDPEASAAREVVFGVAGGPPVAATLPRRPVAPRHPVTAFALASDGRRAVVSYKGRAALDGLFVNGLPAAFRLLRPANAGRPSAAVFDLPAAVAAGASVFLELSFADGTETRAFLRALPGVSLDAVATFGPDGDRMLEGDAAARLGFDAQPRVWRLPLDPLCADQKAGRPGAVAADVAAAATRLRESRPGLLAGVDHCASLGNGDLGLYALLGDAVVLKPYQLHWGADRRDFMGREGDAVARAVSLAAPLPVLWVPERFQAARSLTGVELRDEAWEALLRGARGVRCHHTADGSFERRPEIREAFVRLGREVAALRPRLDLCVPASHTASDGLSVAEAWAGDGGVLLFVRADAPGPVRFTYAVPPWLSPASVEDPLDPSAKPAVVRNGARLAVTLDSAKPGRLLWIANGK